MLNAKQQFSDNWQFYIIGIVVLILIISGIVYFINMQKSQALEAADLYSRGVIEYRQQNHPIAITTLTQVVENYSGTESANLATYLIGKINYDSRNYPEAIRYFEMYLKLNTPDKINRAASLAGIASAYENQVMFAEAAEKFVAAYNENQDGPLVGDYLMAAMRNYLAAGDAVNASVYLDKIKELFEGTDLATRSIRLYTENTLNK